MTRLLGLMVASALLYTGSGPVRVSAQAQSGPAANAAASSSERRFVTTYCATCHNARLKTAELAQ